MKLFGVIFSFVFAFGCTAGSAWAGSPNSFGSSDAASFKCTVQTSTGVQDQVGVDVSFDSLILASSGSKKEALRVRVQTLHQRALPIDPLVLSPIDKIVLANVPQAEREFADGYLINEALPYQIVTSFESNAPALQTFVNQPIVFSAATSAGPRDIQIQFHQSSNQVTIEVHENGIYLDLNSSAETPLQLSYAGPCQRVGDNTDFGF